MATATSAPRGRDAAAISDASVEARADQSWEALVQALTPTVESAIRSSVRRDPQPLAEAIFPIIGPAIRKAIAAAITGLVETINQGAELALSREGLRWRLEAWRTGRPFGEVVIRHRLRYRVEQLFLIYRDSGLLLAHVAQGEAVAPDLVSGMLTAIQEFVRESFNAPSDDALHTLQFGELTVLVEQGPVAIVAAVIRGYAPVSVRATLQDLVEHVHCDYAAALDAYDGDPTAFAALEPRLRECLVTEVSTPVRHRRPRWPLATLGLIAVAGLGIWQVLAARAQRRWDAYVARLASAPGIVVLESGRRDGTWFISGLRDPLALDPGAALDSMGIMRETVDARWRAYLALEPSFVLARARAALAPPPSVILTVRSGTLVATGTAPPSWIEQARRAGVALGAPLDVRSVRNGAIDSLRAIARTLGEMQVYFPTGGARPTPAGARVAEAAIERLRALIVAARAVGASVSVSVLGQTDATGGALVNEALAAARAAYMRDRLARAGIVSRVLARPASHGRTPAASTAEPMPVEASARRVSLLIEVSDGPR